jgi:FAD/FMN-containing dehydrogenase
MSKVASYLRGHLSGEVSVREDVLVAMALDGGVLAQKPEMVIYPRNTNDIRKVARFSWQLAEKGHKLPITVRGAGTDATGAAIGRGISLVTTAHMNRIFEYDTKQKLIRLQPGVTLTALEAALGLHGTGIMALAGSYPYGTVGGAIASATTGIMAGKYKTIEASIDQLEVVLANGDVLQTKRLSKRELNRVKGEQTFAGDIYRGIDRIIDDYADVLDQLRSNDATGYNTIADVKQKDGSFDLTPLFVGSQGTLGVIVEMIMRSEFRSTHIATAALVFESGEQARDALDDICKMAPAFVEYFDAALLDRASAAGKDYDFYVAAKESFSPASVVLVGFDDFSERQRAKHIKRLSKMFDKQPGVMCVTAAGDITDMLADARGIGYYSSSPDHATESAPSLFAGFHVPTERLEEFTKGLAEIAANNHIALPMAGHAYTNIYGIYPMLSLSKVADKQKIFKLLEELTLLVYAHKGTMIAEGGEGRLKTKCVYGQLGERIVRMYTEIRQVCDPHGTLNPGVKQVADVRSMAEMLRGSHDAGQRARYGL